MFVMAWGEGKQRSVCGRSYQLLAPRVEPSPETGQNVIAVVQRELTNISLQPVCN